MSLNQEMHRVGPSFCHNFIDLIISGPNRICIKTDSGYVGYDREVRNRNWSGNYRYFELQNDRKVYKREVKNEFGDYHLLWYNKSKSRWQLNDDGDYKIKRDDCSMYVNSKGKT